MPFISKLTSPNKLSKLFFWLFLISLPFGFRVLFHQFTAGFDEYEAVFLYASDVLMILFLVFTALGKNKFFFQRNLFLSLFLIFSALSIFLASYKLLAFYNFIRLVLLVLMALGVGEMLKKSLISVEKILATLAGLAIFQSLIAFFQFLNQKSLGLWFLGESFLGPGISGAAKITVAGAKILRAYGTFPHSNIFAAFLLLGLFSLYYFWFKEENLKKKSLLEFWVPLAIFVVNLGLVLSFSRTAWFLGIVLTLFFIFYFLFSKNYHRQALYLSIILLSIFFFLFLIMEWAIVPRTQISLAEPAVGQRLAYNELGLYLIKNRPFGIGIGNQVIYSVKKGIYQLLGMNRVWQWQPIHNIYLLIASEIGIPGLAAFLIFIALIMFRNPKSQILNWSLKTMLASILLFGLFDHFSWTLQPGRLMLWLIIGIMLGLAKAVNNTPL